tara:strand:- start:10185 stop:11150 length:966 start_codon:yes stop_codon:yes gene_type:complete
MTSGISKFLCKATVTLAIMFGAGNAQANEFVTFGGGSSGGAFFTIAAGMARVVEKNVDNVQATARVTAATTENTRLLGRERIQFALAAASGPYSAASGLPPFKDERYTNVRYIATGYSSPFQIVVQADSEVQSLADLPGRRVGVLLGITAQDWFPRLAEVYGVAGKFETFELGAGELMTSLRDGNIDVAVISASAPSPAISDLATSRDVRFIPIGTEEANKMISTTHPFFYIDVIPAGTYPGQDKDVQSILNPILLITHANVSTDLVYNVTKVLLDTHHADMSAIHPNAGRFRVENAGKSMVIPPHPGAVKFYKEKGIDLK